MQSSTALTTVLVIISMASIQIFDASVLSQIDAAAFNGRFIQCCTYVHASEGNI